MKQNILVLATFVLFSLNAYSQTQSPPKLLNYQGVLKDAYGVNARDTTYEMTFSIYDQASGGTPLWSEIHSTVSVDSGLFNVILGSTTSNGITIQFDRPYYLGIKVGSHELTPRTLLTPSPYSFMAMNVVDNAITSDKIDDGTIQDEDISKNADISIFKILGDVGIQFNGKEKINDITNTPQTLDTIKINCPLDGYVILMLTGYAEFQGEGIVLKVGLSIMKDSINLNYTKLGKSQGSFSSTYIENFSILDIVKVNEAGLKSYYAVAGKEGANNYSIILHNLKLIGIFIPRKY